MTIEKPEPQTCGTCSHSSVPEAVKAMRAEYLAYVRGYGWLAAKYRCGVSTARDICTWRTRVSA